MKTVRCPQCGEAVDWEKSPSRPFCSQRCRLVDLGAWLEERYVLPGEPASFEDEESS
jgi:endogenous inhibitor of DNA gyrase (YacG/DUF329 family)